jgi:L-fuculose-phosphate aldolase
MSELDLRRAIIATALAINQSGLNRGTSGNVSTRHDAGLLLTPSGVPYEQMLPEDIVAMRFDGTWTGRLQPSSEWRLHRDILATRGEVDAVIHTHATFATTLSCLALEVPAFHYMIAVAGGKSLRCAPYATFGTQELSDHALQALQDRKACLLANHGMITLGATLASALALTVEVEALCEQYWRALQIGEPNILSDSEMDVVLEKFKTYGKRAE